MKMEQDSPPGALGSNAGLGAWVPAHERVPVPGTECVVLLRYSLDRPPFVAVDIWDVQREDQTGMGGPTIETGEGWNDNYESDVLAWIAIPPHPPAEWDQRLPAGAGCGYPYCGGNAPECNSCGSAPNVPLERPYSVRS